MIFSYLNDCLQDSHTIALLDSVKQIFGDSRKSWFHEGKEVRTNSFVRDISIELLIEFSKGSMCCTFLDCVRIERFNKLDTECCIGAENYFEIREIEELSYPTC